MMMIPKSTNRPFSLLLFLILFGFTLQAQSQSEVELIDLLNDTETTYNVTFNYLVEDLDEVRLIPPQEKASLDEVLDHIQQQVPVAFQYVTKTSISISVLKNITTIKFLNASNNNHIPGVVIRSGGQVIATSNRFGTVFLDSSSTYSRLDFQHPKFYSLDKDLDSSSSELYQPIYLYPEIKLDEVFIKEYLAKGISLKSDNSLSIIPQEFGVLPGLINADVLHSLQYVPGIVNTEETIAQINVRGGTHDQNLILWNGSRMYQTGHFFGMISAINPLINHEIQVIKNGSSAFYNEGVSSVIDISSRPHSKPYNTALQLNFLSANASSNLELNQKSTLQVAARRSFTDAWESPTYNGFSDKVFQNTEIQDLLDGDENRITTQQELQFFDASLQYDYAIDADNKLKINVLGIQNQLEFNEILEATSAETQNEFEQDSFLAHVSFQTHWNDRHTSSIDFNASFYELEAFNRSVLSAQDLLQSNAVTDYKLSVKDKYQLFERFKLNLGYQFNEVGVSNTNEVTSPEVILRDKRVLISNSGISEIEYESQQKKLKARLGIRGTHYSGVNVFRIEPRLNFSYQANRSWSWNLLGEIKNQTLTQVIDQQQDFLGIERRRWVLADEEDYPIIHSQQVEGGLNFNRKGWMLQGSLYYKSVEGISSGSQGFQNQLEFLQINGDYEVLGAEFLIQKRLNQFNFWFNFFLMENTYDFSTFNPQQFANNFEITQSSSFGVTYSTEQFQLSAGGRYFAGRPTTEIDLNNPVLTPETNPRLNFLNPNESNLQDYLQVNVTGSYQFEFSASKLKTGLSILNLFNSSNLTQQFYRLEDSGASVESVKVRSLEFTPNLFVTLEF